MAENEFETKVDALINEFRWVIRKPSRLLGNLAFEKGQAVVELDPHARTPIRKQTRFETLPKPLGAGYDPTLREIRNNDVLECLLERRECFAEAFLSGAIGYVLNLHVVQILDEQTRLSISLEYRDASGKKKTVFLTE